MKLLSAAALVTAVALVGCEGAPGHDAPSKDPPPRPTEAPSASVAAPASATSPPVVASAAPKARDGLEGTWEGSYDAKKGAVTLPGKVKDKALAADDGKKAAGSGTITIVVAAGGELRGQGKGALGACTITGKAEDGMIRATLMPEDPRAPDAMTGVLTGILKGDVIKGMIQVAGGDATIVRESPIELSRK